MLRTGLPVGVGDKKHFLPQIGSYCRTAGASARKYMRESGLIAFPICAKNTLFQAHRTDETILTGAAAAPRTDLNRYDKCVEAACGPNKRSLLRPPACRNARHWCPARSPDHRHGHGWCRRCSRGADARSARRKCLLPSAAVTTDIGTPRMTSRLANGVSQDGENRWRTHFPSLSLASAMRWFGVLRPCWIVRQ